jgi:predicted 3-demethylubiquinone-9 3-methyltransferase (glyoxalase superfamily)|tara:strand:+ start:920 stop:1318 length:399 start_codon:yes stop_codon:yes gene_type:complete
MQFEIRDAFRYTSSASLADVVYAIRYEFNESGSSAADPHLNNETHRYFLELDPVPSSVFVAWNSVATSSLKGWVQDSHGGNWGTFTSSLATTMSASLAERVDSQPTTVFHWPSGSHTIDGLEMQSGSNWSAF